VWTGNLGPATPNGDPAATGSTLINRTVSKLRRPEAMVGIWLENDLETLTRPRVKTPGFGVPAVNGDVRASRYG
jgi:hypothetical protein